MGNIWMIGDINHKTDSANKNTKSVIDKIIKEKKNIWWVIGDVLSNIEDHKTNSAYKNANSVINFIQK